MNKELRELLETINNMKGEARELAKTDVVKAKAIIEEIKNLEERFNVEMQLIEDQKEGIEVKNQNKKTEVSMEVKAFKNFVERKPLTGELQNAIVTSADGNALIPEELVRELLEEKKQLVSLKPFTHVVPVSAPSGSVPVETDTNALLVDFDELNDLNEQGLSFRSVSYAVKNRGAITPVSNILIKDSVFGLPGIVAKNFAKKAVRTENADIIAAAKAGKTAKQIKTIAELKKVVNKDIDPAALVGGVIIMNQDTYDKLDNEVDGNGRPLLTASVTDSNIKMFKGLQVVVLSNSELPTTGTTTKKAPMFIGSLKDILFFDPNQYEVAVSDAAGFRQNATLYKVIQRHDVKGGDLNGYVYAEFDVTEATV
jgi:HK97 family phage major capsid protein